jgi:hypothetical protein
LNEKREEAYEPKKSRSAVPPPAKPRGNAEKAFERAAVHHEAEYALPVEHHNPMELFASTVAWEPDDTVTIYDIARRRRFVDGGDGRLGSQRGVRCSRGRALQPDARDRQLAFCRCEVRGRDFRRRPHQTEPPCNPIGVKGLGEIGIVGTAAAFANAVYHATGKRVRDMPITLDKLL